jgi:hypothetical protein
MTDAQRIAQQELETLAAIESGAVRTNTPGVPKEEAPPPADVPPIANQESQASAKFRHELLTSGMSPQEAENTVAEMEGRSPREMPAPKLALVASDVAPQGLGDMAGLKYFAIDRSTPQTPPPVEPIEMTDEEWLAARQRVTKAKARVAAADEAVSAATAELEEALSVLEAAKRAVAAGAAYLTKL